MKSYVSGGALALPLMLCATSAVADDKPADEIVALGQRPDAHGPAGTMGAHTHTKGSVMIGLSWMHDAASGTNRSGRSDISDAAIAAAGFTARTQSMTMDMAMLHVMWAPSDRMTLMLAPSWQRMRMTMVGIAPSTHGAHSLAVGEAMTHRVSGFGDTQAGALVVLSRRPALSAHAGLMLSIPTGSISRKDADGNFVHYGMQPGSGTWDLTPSLTLRGTGRSFGWGVQASYLWRTSDHNRNGFAFGDRFNATAWIAKPVTRHASLSARLGWTTEGPVKGHYNAGHNHASPPDRQANYGGERLDAGIGANFVLGEHLRLEVEASVPLTQKLNGIQVPRKFASSVGLSRAF